MDPAFDLDFQQQLASLLGWRRDVRRFRAAPIAEDVIENLLELAQKAPSVGNSQPWRFVRIRSTAVREALAAHVDLQVAAAGERLADPEKRAAYAALKLHGLDRAAEVIAVFCDDGTATGSGLGAATMPETRAYSVVLAIHTFWLAARAKGLALGWVSIVDPAFVTALLDAPPQWKLIATLCLGWPEEPSDTPELERLDWQARVPWRQNVSEV